MRAMVAAVAILFVSATDGNREMQILARRPCERVQLVSTTDWIRSVQRDGFSLQLPRCFQPVPDAPQYVHGGNQWRCGTATVEVVWGSWGSDSFKDREACGATISGLPVIVARRANDGTPGVFVRYFTGLVHEPIIAAVDTRAADVPLLTTIAYSGQLVVSREPKR